MLDLAPGVVTTAKPAAPVIETNGYCPHERDGRIEAIETGMPESLSVSGRPRVQGLQRNLLEAPVAGEGRRAVRKDVSGSRWRDMIRPASRSSSTCSTSWASSRLTPVPRPSPGASSPAPGLRCRPGWQRRVRALAEAFAGRTNAVRAEA
jgi:hypothetical protein